MFKFGRWKMEVGDWKSEDGSWRLGINYILYSIFYKLIQLGTNCAQTGGTSWDKPVAKRAQVVRRLMKFIENTGSLHSQTQSAGKLGLVSSPVYPQPNFHISQMERAVYTQYPQSLLLRLLFNIIRERAA